MRNHVKLEICSIVMNFSSGGFSVWVPYYVVDSSYGLGRSLGLVDTLVTHANMRRVLAKLPCSETAVASCLLS